MSVLAGRCQPNFLSSSALFDAGKPPGSGAAVIPNQDTIARPKKITRSRMTKVGFRFFVFAICALGLLAGYRLSGVPRLETYKLLNVVGLLYDFLGIVVLSDLAISNPKWKKASVDLIAPAVLWLHTIFPFGVLLGSAG